jgi:hypothetical protein
MMQGLRMLLPFLALAMATPLALAAEHRLTIFDLELGRPVAELPLPVAFKGYACGSDGGPPGVPLSGFGDFGRCAAEADGLHEVYFEYDDEAEYVARAHEDYAGGWQAGTAYESFPIIASALFDAGGVLRGVRLVSDPRPEEREDRFVRLRPRQEHYLLRHKWVRD